MFFDESSTTGSNGVTNPHCLTQYIVRQTRCRACFGSAAFMVPLGFCTHLAVHQMWHLFRAHLAVHQIWHLFCTHLAVHQMWHLFPSGNASVFSKRVKTLEPELVWQREEGDIGVICTAGCKVWVLQQKWISWVKDLQNGRTFVHSADLVLWSEACAVKIVRYTVEISMAGHIVVKRPNTEFSGNFFKGPRVVSCVQKKNWRCGFCGRLRGLRTLKKCVELSC